MKKLTKNKKFLLIIILIYAIIKISNLNYATDNAVDYKIVSYTISGPITVDPYIYSIWTDAIKFHIDANGYDSKYGDNCTNNFLVYNPDLSAERKAKGYGQYTYKLKALKEFIEYCYVQNQSHTNQSATILGATENDSCDYTKLVSLSQSTLSGKSRQFMATFWNGMLILGNTFNEYQDSYFFKSNTLKAIEKIQGALSSEGLEADGLTVRNLSDNRKASAYINQSSREYLTLLTTYMYSINREEKLASVGKGDLVPFLYFAEHTDITDPYEIGKYAYIALMNEFLKISGTNYWQPEFDFLYFNGEGFTDRELYEDDGRPDLATLEDWYDETYEKYKNDRGAKQNPLIGSDPDTIISSNYTISYQVEAMKDYVQDIYAELGIDMNVNDFIAKNELMARYMMESSKLDDTIKDYNVSIKFVEENLQRGTYFEENTSTAVLSDMQVLTFNHTLDIDGQSDGDNISDKTELGNVSKIDITGFVEKMCLSKYGRDISQCEAIIDEIVANNGYNPEIPNSGHIIKEKDISGNIKVYYRVYNYTSNPMLIDTDFDGINDNIDSSKKDNNFKGNTGKIGNIEYNNDFRYFYINNKKYNDELSTMSLMMSNLANGESISTNQVNGDMSTYLNTLGFTNMHTKNTFNITENETINGRLYLAKKTIQTGATSIANRRYKDVYGIFLGKFDSADNYKKLITNFNTDEIKEYYENIVTDCINFIRANRVATTNDYCYWVSGYGLSGAIAAEIANEFIKDGEVYCYTFGATSGNGSSGVNREIKNVINEDDLIPKLNNHSDGFGRSGIIVNDSIYDNFIVEYKQITGSDKYEAKHKRANSLKQIIVDAKNNNDEYYRNIIEEHLSRILYNYQNMIEPFIISTNANLFSVLNANLKKIKQGHEIKSYYVLAKLLDGYAENNSNSTWGYMDIDFDSFEELYTGDDRYPEDLLTTIEIVGNWYIQNVPTYETDEKANRTTQTQRDNANKLRNDAWGGIYIYKYDDLDEQTSDYVERKIEELRNEFRERYPTDNLPNDNLTNYLKFGAGDDCVRFGMTVYNYLTEGKLFDLHNEILDGQSEANWKSNLLNYGQTILLRNANRFVDSGYELDDWFDSIGYYRIDVDEDFDIKDLKPGDFLCASGGSQSGHVEFYLGYNYVVNQDGEYERDRTIAKTNNIPGFGGKAEGTYGWGTVSRKIPSYELQGGNEYNWYFYKSRDDRHIYRCRGYHDYTNHNDRCCDQRAYDVIYRKKGY